MHKRLMLLMVVVSLCAAPTVHAGIWGNFWGAVGKTVEDYNADTMATGEAVGAALKAGEFNAAFTSFETNYSLTGEHALANSKAVYSALKEIVLWIPNQIKKVWDKIVEVLQKLRDNLNAINESLGGGSQPAPAVAPASAPGAPTATSKSIRPNLSVKASTTSKRSNAFTEAFSFGAVSESAPPTANGLGLGDGFVERFKATDLPSKLHTFKIYRGHIALSDKWMQSLEAAHQKAISPNFEKMTSECNLLEDLLFEEIGSSVDGDGKALAEFTKYLQSNVEKEEAQVALAGLVKKLSRRTAMASVHSQASSEAKACIAKFAQAKEKLGLK